MKARLTREHLLHSPCFTLIYIVFLFCLSLSLFLAPLKEQLIYHDLTKDSSLEKRLLVFTHEAVVTFIDANDVEHVLFNSGVQTDKAFQIFAHRLQIRPDHGDLMFTLMDLQSSDVGKYEISGLGGLAAAIWLSETGGK